MSTPAFNTVSWFEVATDDPESAERFYGDLFGWRFTVDEESVGGGLDYRIIDYGDGRPSGGLFGTKGQFPNHGIFTVVVEDVAAACDKTESLGGKVIFRKLGNASGPDFAYMTDTSGNLFGVFSPATE
ncbi:VOC family protein [Streptosporangiaceae bacterium NEAU-GS5]|nr:VOC family protein [Streptosporangiaceae bacterium NEAU-GS5]